jgi:hypothetical protein
LRPPRWELRFAFYVIPAHRKGAPTGSCPNPALTHRRNRPANTAAIPNRRPAERSDEITPSKANAHLALPCEQWIKRMTARQPATGRPEPDRASPVDGPAAGRRRPVARLEEVAPGAPGAAFRIRQQTWIIGTG